MEKTKTYCSPCRRGACEDCHAADHPNLPTIYACATGHQDCGRATGHDELPGGDFGIGGVA
ncbi:hypothetical protein ACFCXP_37650 [Streptomyces niveus]|uniref:hypothetical protein n=1 Tax=Streptomyces niveus TaxID=193462 RepID=UPI0035DB683E